MASTSVSLESLKFLLQHMDANRRFETSSRCPALRAIEKSIPLNINSLALKGNGVTVNDTTYCLGIIQEFIVGEAPGYVTASNKRVGVPYEVDRYGIRDYSDAYTVTPGDVRIEPRGEPWIPTEDLQIRQLEMQIEHYEVRLAQQREMGLEQNRGTARMEKIIEEARAKLSVYQCRRENIPPNYEHFLQLTTYRTVDQQQQIRQRYAHNKKFSETMKQLTTVLFAGRNSPIYVKTFACDFSRGVVRLPIDLKFHIETLKVQGDVGRTLEGSTPILHESSFPLKNLDMGLLSMIDFTNPILRAAGTLRFTVVSLDILQNISDITNPVVRINVMMLSEQALDAFVANWIETKSLIGTEYTIGLRHQEPCFADEMEDILKRLNGVPIDDENVNIPMSNATQLKVTYGPFPEFAPYYKWAAKFSTVAIDH